MRAATPSPTAREDRIVRLGWVLTGALLAASSALAADLALEHMRLAGTICGSASSPHCAWCVAAAALVTGASTAFAFAFRRTAPVRIPGLLQIKADGERA